MVTTMIKVMMTMIALIIKMTTPGRISCQDIILGIGITILHYEDDEDDGTNDDCKDDPLPHLGVILQSSSFLFQVTGSKTSPMRWVFFSYASSSTLHPRQRVGQS